eukprot:362997-Chlamydomonas_euryale.AAC.3
MLSRPAERLGTGRCIPLSPKPVQGMYESGRSAANARLRLVKAHATRPPIGPVNALHDPKTLTDTESLTSRAIEADMDFYRCGDAANDRGFGMPSHGDGACSLPVWRIHTRQRARPRACTKRGALRRLPPEIFQSRRRTWIAGRLRCAEQHASSRLSPEGPGTGRIGRQWQLRGGRGEGGELQRVHWQRHARIPAPVVRMPDCWADAHGAVRQPPVWVGGTAMRS